MTQSERMGYLTSKQCKAAKKWAQAEFDKLAPDVRKIYTNTVDKWNEWDFFENNKTKAYAQKLLGVIKGWLAINEDAELFNKWATSSYVC